MKKIYVVPSIKAIALGTLYPLAGSGDPNGDHDATWGPDDEYSKRFTGGIEFDDEEDSGSDSAW